MCPPITLAGNARARDVLVAMAAALRVRFQARDEWDATSANLFECLLEAAP